MIRAKVENFQKLFSFLFICKVLVICMTFFLIQQSTKPEYNSEESQKTTSCGRFPKEEHILDENVVWQVLEMPKGFVNLLNAYLDDRMNRTIVRINASGIKLNITVDAIFCQFWFDEISEPQVVKATQYLLIWLEAWGVHSGDNYPYLISCPFEHGHHENRFPKSVSLTVNLCDEAENNLKIINNQPVGGVKKKFGVCSKQISYTNRDFGIRLVEWVHLLNILGNDKVHLYNRYVHPEVYKVLQYMENQGLIEMWSYLEPKANDLHTWQAHLLEMNILNDCFYRIRNLYEYIVILDVDEVIMPVISTDKSWSDLMGRFNKSLNDAWSSENVYYPEVGAKPLEEVPKYHYMLQHIQRSVNLSIPGSGVKSILAPDDVLIVHNYIALYCLNWSTDLKADPYVSCRRLSMPTNMSQLSHFREFPKDVIFNKTVEDKTMWKFKDQLIEAVSATLNATQFKP